jgi:hypothetical protein
MSAPVEPLAKSATESPVEPLDLASSTSRQLSAETQEFVIELNELHERESRRVDAAIQRWRHWGQQLDTVIRAMPDRVVSEPRCLDENYDQLPVSHHLHDIDVDGLRDQLIAVLRAADVVASGLDRAWMRTCERREQELERCYELERQAQPSGTTS